MSSFPCAGGAVDERWIMLRFLGEALEPDSVSALLGISPTSSGRKGEPSSDGRRSLCQTGFWVLECERTSDSPDNQIQHLLRADLPQDLEMWRSLSTNYTGEMKLNLAPAKWARGAIVGADTI